MMKHESANKASLLLGGGGGGGGHGGSAEQSKSSSKRSGLWRMRSLSEAPTSAPRSPITKAFDFLPWSRGKRNNADVKAQSPSPPVARSTTNINGTNANAADAEKKDTAAVHYHRNIFRSGGGLIRDILSDRLHKEKINNNNYNNTNNNNSRSQRKLKQITARNKSLDINELISNVENNLNENESCLKRNGSKQRFLDDTFIENVLRDKTPTSGWYNHSDEDEEDVEVDIDDPDCGIYRQQPHAQENTLRSSLHGSGNSSGNNAAGPAKHILFNDENVVYLIKKELPVRRRDGNKIVDTPKSSKKISQSSGERATSLRDHNNVMRARLKFKKITPEAASNNSNCGSLPSSWSHSAKQPTNVALSRNKCYQTIAKSSGNIVGESSTSSSNKRGILQRQNTSPALGAGTPSATLSPSPVLTNSHSHNSITRRTPQQHTSRRRSLTELFPFEQQIPQQPQQQQQQQHLAQPQQRQYYEHSSSSSSMGSGVSNGGHGIAFERSRNEKPRKKLSFREPVVTEKERIRRLSSPLQRSPFDMERELRAPSLEGDRERDRDRDHNAPCPVDLNSKRFTLQNQNSLDVVVCGDNESQAMRIVRTVGQAFEVCHKFNFHKNSVDHNDERSDVSSELLDVERISEQQLSDEDTNKKEQLSTAADLNSVPSPPQRPNHLELMPRASPSASIDDDKSLVTPTSPSQEIMKLKDQLEQQALQTRQALAQLMLVREQLISETNARIEAQARTQQLLQQNRELLEHLASLGAYNEQQAAGLTSANIAMAPQSQLQMLLQATNTNNNLATINQQISNLGCINQQLTSLSHQLSGLNQQSQNLQNFQNIQNINSNLQQQQQQQQPQSPQQLHQQQPQSQSQQGNSTPLSGLLNTPNSTTTITNTNTSPYPSMNQLQSISNQLQQINAQSAQQQLQQDALSKDLMQVNQELLNRLQALNLGNTATTSGTVNAAAAAGAAAPTVAGPTTTPHNSFFFVNPMSCSPQPNNNNNNTNNNNNNNNNTNNNNNVPSNFNFLNSLSGATSNSGISGNLTPSPLSTLNRNSYTHSPIADLEALRLSIDKNLNRIDEFGLLTSPLAQQLTGVSSNGNLVGLASGQTSTPTTTTTTTDNSRSTSTIDSQSSPRVRQGNETPLLFNTVTLKVTDEAGNVTNQRKLSATPSFITRSTSEKVPNRSQMMSEVQRTTWARHTTK